eukprot:4385796-Pyramimonas_sp.AAC.1
MPESHSVASLVLRVLARQSLQCHKSSVLNAAPLTAKAEMQFKRLVCTLFWANDHAYVHVPPPPPPPVPPAMVSPSFQTCSP